VLAARSLQTTIIPRHLHAIRKAMPPLPNYVLVTPARNEAVYIEATIQSMIAQTHRPLKWLIVSDGSTDNTDDIVRSYLDAHDWIELFRMPEREERDFAGKAHAFNIGHQRVKDLDFEVIGNLDADVTFEPQHFAYLVAKFVENPQLGVAGAPFIEGNYRYDYRFTGTENVWGGCQLLRRACLEAIGGYTPLKGGGVDLVAALTARMRGWETRTYMDSMCVHHRVMNSAMSDRFTRKFKWGRSDYRLGSHPSWQLFRSTYQLTKQPYIVGGLLILIGYFTAYLTRQPRTVSPEVAEFRGREQMQRLKAYLSARQSAPAEPAGSLKCLPPDSVRPQPASDRS
jgi:biofilm PGA synthesis N-glycosyltransferase PgaC